MTKRACRRSAPPARRQLRLVLLPNDIKQANWLITPLVGHHVVRRKAVVSPRSPVGHVQEEGAAGRVELEAQQPLELRNEDVFVRGAHAAELQHELRVHVHVRALHGWRVSRSGDGSVRPSSLSLVRGPVQP